MISVTTGMGWDCNGTPISGCFQTGNVIVADQSFKISTSKSIHDICYINGKYDGGLMCDIQNLIIEIIIKRYLNQRKG